MSIQIFKIWPHNCKVYAPKFSKCHAFANVMIITFSVPTLTGLCQMTLVSHPADAPWMIEICSQSTILSPNKPVPCKSLFLDQLSVEQTILYSQRKRPYLNESVPGIYCTAAQASSGVKFWQPWQSTWVVEWTHWVCPWQVWDGQHQNRIRPDSSLDCWQWVGHPRPWKMWLRDLWRRKVWRCIAPEQCS